MKIAVFQMFKTLGGTLNTFGWCFQYTLWGVFSNLCQDSVGDVLIGGYDFQRDVRMSSLSRYIGRTSWFNQIDSDRTRLS